MASPLMTKLVALVIAVAICSMLSVDAYACAFCFASSRTRNRKVLTDTVNGMRGLRRSSSNGVQMYSRRWKLREVPRGPDPLHHNRGSPYKTKPRTTTSSITPPA